MAKKVLTLIKLQIPGGQANPAPPVGPALGQHGVNIMEFCKAFNAQTAQAERPHHAGRDHRLRGPLVHLHHEDAAGGCPDQGGAEPREGLGRAEPHEGRPPDAGAGAPDRRDEARRPERARRRAGDEGSRRDGPIHGRGGGRVTMNARPRPECATRHSTESATTRSASRSTARSSTRRSRRSGRSRTGRRRSSTRRSRCTSTWASTCATPTSSCAAR